MTLYLLGAWLTACLAFTVYAHNEDAHTVNPAWLDFLVIAAVSMGWVVLVAVVVGLKVRKLLLRH